MNTESSCSRVMSCLAETAISVGISEEEVKHLPYSIAAIVWGFNGITTLGSKTGLIEQISRATHSQLMMQNGLIPTS